MIPKYEKGQKVTITPVSSQPLSSRDADIEEYAGQTGEIKDYFWISKRGGAEVFYIYTVAVEPEHKEVVLHEDELAACIA